MAKGISKAGALIYFYNLNVLIRIDCTQSKIKKNENYIFNDKKLNLSHKILVYGEIEILN